MSSIYILVFLYVIAGIIRGLGQRFASHDYSPAENSVQFAVWTGLAGLVMLPFFGHMFTTPDLPKIYIIVLGLFKGIFFYLTYNFTHRVVKKSITTTIYSGPLSIGFIAAFNAFVLGELLTPIQWSAVFALFIAGLIYAIVGHLRHFSAFELFSLIIMIASNVVFNALDYTVISETNWFVQFLLFPWGILLGVLFFNPKTLLQFKLYLGKRGATYGIIFAITDIFILLPRVAVLPVSIVNILSLSVVPVYMYLAAHYFKEDVPRKQLIFGVFAALCAFVVLMYQTP